MKKRNSKAEKKLTKKLEKLGTQGKQASKQKKKMVWSPTWAREQVSPRPISRKDPEWDSDKHNSYLSHS